ncbi:hypothetical protein ACRAWF_34880 [Streptomyces sp. L7]
MQPVDVLRDDPHGYAGLLQLDDRPVRGVRFGLERAVLPPQLPGPAPDLGVAHVVRSTSRVSRPQDPAATARRDRRSGILESVEMPAPTQWRGDEEACSWAEGRSPAPMEANGCSTALGRLQRVAAIQQHDAATRQALGIGASRLLTSVRMFVGAPAGKAKRPRPWPR